MIKKSVKISLEIVSIFSILSMLTMVALFIWVMLAPRTLFFITPYLEKELSSINSKFKVKIDESIVKWDTQQHSIGIHTTNVTVLNDTNDTVATFPEISFGFSLLLFLRGHFLSPDLTIIKPSIYVDTASKALYVTPASNTDINGVIFNTIYSTLNSSNASFKIHSVRVKDAKIFINTSNSNMLWSIDEGYAKVERIKSKNRIRSEFKINFGKDNTYFDINAESTDEKTINTEIHFKELPSYTLADIFPDYDIEKKMNMYFSGMVKLYVPDTGTLSGVQLVLDNASGHLDLPEFFNERIAIKNLKLDAKLSDNFSHLAINDMELDLHGPTLKVSGNITNSKTWPEFIPNIDTEVTILNLESADLENYWPYDFSSIPREWILNNIKNGLIKSATGKFKFSAEDITNLIERHKSEEKPSTSPIPDSAIDATINIEKATVSYMEHYPQANDVKAVVKFTGQSMDASVESAKMLGASISNAHVKFDNLWQHPLKIGITGHFDGESQNLIQFLKLNSIKTADNKAMTSIYNISGHTTGDVDLTIPIIPGTKYDDADIKISANFKNALLPGLINDKNVSATNVDFVLDHRDINVKGDAVINNIPASIELHKNFSSNAPDLQLKLKGTFSPPDLKDLGLNEIPFVTGKMALDVDLAIKNDSTNITGTADLTQSTVAIEGIGFEKPAGKSGKATFNITKSGKENLDIKDFKLQGDGFSITGNGKVDSALSGVSDFSITNAKFGNNDFVASYKSSESGSKVSISGKSLDISKSKISDLLRQDPSKIKKSLDMDITLKNLYMKNGEIFHEFASDLNCSAQICSMGHLYGKIRDGNFIVASLKNIGDRSALLIESDNAGAIINALNISKDIVGGHLNIDSTIGKNNGVVAQGVIKIVDFKAVKTPLLGKMLTLASFRGFEDLLNNEGISFKRFEAPFTMANGVITVKNAKSSGASIGITAEGTIDTVHDDIDLKGVIVPAYAVNNIIGKIPFVGKIIIGKENEGIIATKYSLKGSYDDAKINVNPLSILAPGFIRNIFDVFN